jgi:hypothetical protein
MSSKSRLYVTYESSELSDHGSELCKEASSGGVGGHRRPQVGNEATAGNRGRRARRADNAVRLDVWLSKRPGPS